MIGFCVECGRQLNDDGTCPAKDCPSKTAEVLSADVSAGLGGLGSRLETAPPIPAVLVGAPEQGIGPLPKASTSRRLLGSGIEYLVYQVAILGLNIVGPWTGGLIGLLWVPLLLAMVGLRDVKSGRFSLGKRVGGMRVVDRLTAQPATDVQALKRNSYYLVLIFLMIFPFVKVVPSVLFFLLMVLDILMIVASPDGRRLGDYFAGTQVVPEARS